MLFKTISMLKNALLVFFGGGLGSLLRYGVQNSIDTYWPFKGGFPLGTFIVNFTGSLLIGIILGLLGGNSQHFARFLFVAGFCGGFTTFSTFSNDTLNLLNQGAYGAAALYSVGTLTVCVAMTGIGYLLVKIWK